MSSTTVSVLVDGRRRKKKKEDEQWKTGHGGVPRPETEYTEMHKLAKVDLGRSVTR